ncbi:MAG: hypothetical protein AB7G44_07335 [Bacteroidia bacterium]
MKKSLLIICFLGLTFKGFTQDYLDKIAQSSCECLDKVGDTTLTTDAYNMKLGLCMLEASVPYKKQLKKDYNIDFAKIDEQGEELGALIGMRMASHCPEGLLKIAAMYNDGTEGTVEEEEYTDNSASGVVIKVETEFFVTFSVKDDAGKISKYYWLSFPDSNQELQYSYKDLLAKNVTINYTPQDFFDPKIEAYRQFNVISRIDTQ